MSDHHCGRMDHHDPHEWVYSVPNVVGYAQWPMVVDCPGTVTVEGGALDLHDCGARVHPSEIRDCCRRCESTICPACSPCRRVS